MTRIRWRARTWLAVAGVILGLVAAAAPSVSASPMRGHAGGNSPVVGTSNGAVRGLANGAVDEFLGIPYAAPPVGALRWRPPQPAARWSGVRDATQFGSHCPQVASPFGEASTSENCLFLNVFTPSRQRDRRHSPVMVWIHGGALVTGGSDDYLPTNLVQDGVTVVTINYRLGALGFLAHPALADANGQSGDYGLMDQQAALRWVKRNIAGFGGDPRNVTIFGESAGGLSTLSQVASPQARGLFEKAIVESGSYNLTQASLASAESAGEAFAAQAGCASQTAACLRGLPVSTILANEDAGGYTPNINTEVLPESLGTAFATGNFNRVPIINGTNHDEWRLFVALSALEGNAGDRRELPEHDLFHARGAVGGCRGHRRRVPVERVLQPFSCPRRGRHRRHLRVPRADHRPVRLALRADVRLRVQRRERTGGLPPAARLPLRRGSRIGDPVPDGPASSRFSQERSRRPSSSWRRPCRGTGRTLPSADSPLRSGVLSGSPSKTPLNGCSR